MYDAQFSKVQRRRSIAERDPDAVASPIGELASTLYSQYCCSLKRKQAPLAGVGGATWLR